MQKIKPFQVTMAVELTASSYINHKFKGGFRVTEVLSILDYRAPQALHLVGFWLRI